MGRFSSLVEKKIPPPKKIKPTIKIPIKAHTTWTQPPIDFSNDFPTLSASVNKPTILNFKNIIPTIEKIKPQLLIINTTQHLPSIVPMQTKLENNLNLKRIEIARRDKWIRIRYGETFYDDDIYPENNVYVDDYDSDEFDI